MRLRRLGSKASLGKKLVSKALVNLNETGIVTDGSGYVTEWTNSGSGGSAYDLDTVVATLANSTTTTINGLTAVRSTGSYGLEPTAGQSINSPGTVFLVAKCSNATPGYQSLLSSRSSTSAAWIIGTDDGSADDFYINQSVGSIVVKVSPYDQALHVITGQFNGDASTSLTVSGVGTATGDAGAHNWDYCTLFANYAGSQSTAGDIAQVLVFDYALNASEILSVETYLKAKWL